MLVQTGLPRESDFAKYGMTQLLTNLPATPMSRPDAWLPDRWKLNQAAITA